MADDIARGSQAVIGLYEETAYKTPGVNGFRLYVTKSSMGRKIALDKSNMLINSRRQMAPVMGNQDVSGTIESEISHDNLGHLIKHAMGTVATTGTGPYVHTFTVADTLPIGLTIEHDNGPAINPAARYERFSGCRINKMDLEFKATGFCMASFDLIGSSAVFSSTPLDATLTNQEHTAFGGTRASITEAGLAIATITDAKLSLDNGLDDSIYTIDGTAQRYAVPEGIAQVTGELTALFDNSNLIAKATNGTFTSLVFRLQRGTGDGSAGNELVSFTCPNVMLSRTNDDGIDGPKGRLIKLDFTASGTIAISPLTIVTKNMIAAI